MAKSSLTVPMLIACGSSDHGVIAGVRDRAAGHHRDLLAARAPAQALVDRVAMQVARAMAAARGEAFDEHFDDVIEGLARKFGVRPGVAHQREERVLVPFLRADLGDESAARGHRTAPAACAARRVRRGARSRARPRIRPGRRAIAGTGGPSARRPRSGPNGPRVAGRRRSRAANRAGTTRSTSPMSMPSSSDAVATSTFSCPRLQALLRGQAQFLRERCRGARRRVPCRADRRDGARRARPCGAC